ncbi:tubulin epsilon and delta complex protein 1 [Apis mellifera caucasica]|uniref:Tubulin epsilon and delta complex protein 1 n=1 Tax=Apis mellifera TaxID=7460 RepID=A0A7M7IK76_APIME|nr:tubulin epsilon and delta complex protein 1 [Apis mellifera]KAG6796849.1 tubulin epsilon and delta complex protein 1 [Apis mellifera caucasica]|eukprot:XP_016769925.1 tubulin epsilon and delta complex protein 1 [Apis mellifera]
MSDIKSVLSLLCQHLNLSINVMMKPEYFRQAKFNGMDENIDKIFWKILNVLSYYAVKEKQIETNFEQYDTIWATKLYFAYLQYPAIEFYTLTEQNKNSRALLLAFAWLLGTQNILNIIIQINLSNSILAREFSYSNNLEKKETECYIPESIIAQINNVLYLNGRVNYNIKEISELISERTKLVSKIHAASNKICGLPHLSVSEAALIKRISTINKDVLSNEDKKHIKELSTIANLLNIHMKWMKKEHIFFEWMITVIQEHNKLQNVNLEDMDWNEVSKFISLLCCIIQEKLETLSSKEKSMNSLDCERKCISRLLKVQDNNTEIERWLMEISTELNEKTENITKKKEKLFKKLEKILQSIPYCVQV